MVNGSDGTFQTPETPQQMAARLEDYERQLEGMRQENAKLKEAEAIRKSTPEHNKAGSSKDIMASIVKQLNFSEIEIPDFNSNKSTTVHITDDSIPTGDNSGNLNNNEDNDHTKLALYLLQEFQRLKNTMVKIPGMPMPLEKAGLDSYADSPFTDKIALTDLTKKFSVPNMKQYDGSTDPLDHVAQYKQKMFIVPLDKDKREAGMCKGFGSTLTGPALQWFINLPNGTISSFANLVNAFNQQFACSRQLEKHSNDLLRIIQRPEEKSRDYLKRFTKEMISIPHCDVFIACEAFRQGVIRDSELYNELTKHPCQTFEDVQAKTLAIIRLEEDRLARAPRSDYDRSNRKTPNQKTNERTTPYRKPGRNDVNSAQRQTYPPIDDYKFKIDLAGLLDALANMGTVVRWPRKNDNPNPDRDTSKWCAFHKESGHLTEDCFILRKEVDRLFKSGYLTDLLPEAKTDKTEKRPPPPPPPSKVVNFITGGSELCGLTHSAAKRIAKETKMQPPAGPSVSMDAITFDQSDADAIPSVHHDALVIRLHIGTCLIGRILVDGGSSVNIIMMSTLKEMGIDEDKLIKNSSALVGFSGEVAHTKGEISLPIYLEGVTTYEKFNVIDCLSSYNVLLGRPWIHNLKAVPSTYHQCVKIPTNWGVITIKGETRMAQECYSLAMKSSNKGKRPA